MLKQRKTLAILVCLAFTPAIVPLWLITQYGVDFPFWDQWMPDIAGMFIRAHQHTLSLADLASQHNEHRILLPRIIYLGLGLLTQWSIRAELISSWLIVCCSSLVLLWLMITSEVATGAPGEGRRYTGHTVFLWGVANLLLFAPSQWENWLYGIGLTNFLPAFFVILLVAVLAGGDSNGRRLGLAIAICVAATFSSGSGFLSWPVALLMIVRFSPRVEVRARLAAVGVVIGSMALCAAIYSIGYSSPSHSGSNPYLFAPLQSVQYFLVFLGNAFAYTTPYDATFVSGAFGAFILLAFMGAGAYYVWLLSDGRSADQARRCILPWLCLGFYAVGNAVIASAARTGLGPSQALASRYVSFSLFLPLSVIVLLTKLCESSFSIKELSSQWHAQHIDRVIRHLPVVAITALLIFYFEAYKSVLVHVKLSNSSQLEARTAVLLSRILPNDPKLGLAISPVPAGFIEQAIQLDALGYLRPRLIAAISETSNVRDARSQALPVGRLERIWESAPGVLSVSGWTQSSGKPVSQRAIVVTYRASAVQQPVALVTASLELTPQTEHNSAGRVNWGASIPVARLPSEASNVTLEGWLFDLSKSSLIKLDGAIVVNR